jgi:hypothetical protein
MSENLDDHQSVTSCFIMDLFKELPEEALAMIFEHLDAAETLSVRRVCHDWRRRLIGCAHLVFKSVHGGSQDPLRSVTLKGMKASTAVKDGKIPNTSLRRIVKRTRGHLPEPNVLPDAPGSIFEKPLEFRSTGARSGAMRIEDPESHWQCLDLSQSSCHIFRLRTERLIQAHGTSITAHRRFEQTPLLKQVLCEVDLSGIRRLERLSVRGCGNLQILQLPPSLEALDAFGCTRLVRIALPFGQHARLQALNLSGCRSLKAYDNTGHLFGSSTGEVMRFIQELDMSSTNSLGEAVMADAVRAASKLRSVSLRYVATDEIIIALAAGGDSSGETLRLIDASFSSRLTDRSVEILVNAASKLERFNLRACGSVSSACYNGVPLEIEDRKNRSCANRGPFSVLGGTKTHLKRKGDNIFFFAGGEKSAKARIN